jgi:hypothetical protein
LDDIELRFHAWIADWCYGTAHKEHAISGNHIDVVFLWEPAQICPLIFPYYWQDSVHVGRLPPGIYEVDAAVYEPLWLFPTVTTSFAFQVGPVSYLVGDVYPSSLATDWNRDGDADDCGEFGDGVIDWMDVVTTYYCYRGYLCPELLSDRFGAMDSYPLDATDELCIVLQYGGDGIIDWMDVVAAFHLYRSPMLCRPSRPCGWCTWCLPD